MNITKVKNNRNKLRKETITEGNWPTQKHLAIRCFLSNKQALWE